MFRGHENQATEREYTYVNPNIRHARKLELAGIESFICTTGNELVKKIISGISGVKVHLHLQFISRLRLPLGSRMGCAPIFTNVIAIPIFPIKKNCNLDRIRNRVLNRRC